MHSVREQLLISGDLLTDNDGDVHILPVHHASTVARKAIRARDADNYLAPEDVQDKRLALFPMHTGGWHWVLVCHDMQTGRSTHCDSWNPARGHRDRAIRVLKFMCRMLKRKFDDSNALAPCDTQYLNNIMGRGHVWIVMLLCVDSCCRNASQNL